MSLPVLALFNRQLSADARSRGTYFLRMAPLIALAGMLLLYGRGARVGAPGLAVFGTIMYVNLGVVTLLAVTHFATSISEEKEAQTLTLLRMTQLNPAAILFGKAASRGTAAALFLIVQAPLTILAITLGGVSLRQVAAAYVVLLGWLVFVGGLAVLCSLISATDRSARRWVIMVLVAFFVVLPVAYRLLRPVGFPWVSWSADGVLMGLREHDPFNELGRILETSFAGNLRPLRAWNNAAVGSALFLACWPLFDRFTRERGGRWFSLPRRLVRLLRAGRSPIWRDPIAWKDFHFSAGGWPVMAAKSLLYSGGIVAVCIIEPDAVQWLPVPIALMFCLEWCQLPARSLASEVRGKTLSALILLPIHTDNLVRRKYDGCLYAMIPVSVALLVSASVGVGAAFLPHRDRVAGIIQLAWYAVLVLVAVAVASIVSRNIALSTISGQLRSRGASYVTKVVLAVVIALVVVLGSCFGLLAAVLVIAWLSRRRGSDARTIPTVLEELAAEE